MHVLTIEQVQRQSGESVTSWITKDASSNTNIFPGGPPAKACLGPALLERSSRAAAQGGMAGDQLKALFYFVLVNRVDIWSKASSCEMMRSCQFLS